MKTIQLTQGKVALVDDEDFERLSEHKWLAVRGYKETFYAARRVSKKTVYMHWIVLDVPIPSHIEVDHIDGDGLNNQLSNLRLATRQENSRNMRKPESNTSGVKGVVWHKKGKKWQAQIKTNGKNIYLGLFTSKEDAYKAYCEACVKHHGEFARVV